MTTETGVAGPASLAGLAALGLEPLDEQVYRGLLRRPSWPAHGLAERLGFAPAEVSGAVERLTAMRLVRSTGDGDVQAVSPRIGLAALVASREAELADRRWELEQSRLAAAALAVEHDTPRRRTPAAGSPDVVYGEAAVRGRVAALIGEATSSVIAISLSSGGYLDPVALPPTATHAAVRRGVTVRSVYFDRVRADPRLGEYVRELVSAGAFVRTTRALPTSALAVDDKMVVLPVALSMTGKRPGVVLLRLPGVVTAISELFERVWAGASPLGDGTPDGLDDREHELLGLLLSGSTDESAAAHLGVSVRTVRRIVARLMDTLDARSRFEAGARAVLHGWPAR
jgi:DNA-binding CsgD family transcriptional regulator